MSVAQLRVAALAAVFAAMSSVGAFAQNPPPSPAIKNPNPATSASTDDEGLNPSAREGENSPTGQGPSVATNPPLEGTVGAGPGSAEDEKATPPKRNPGK